MIARRLAAVACMVLALSACSVAAGSSEPHVSVIGDSITYLSATDINTTLEANHFQPTTIGRIGYTAAQAQADVIAQAKTHPAVVVFELGTNDVTLSDTGAADSAGYERTLTRYKTLFPHSCLVATTVSSHRPSPTMDDTATEINTWLVHNFAHVIDWDRHEWVEREQGHFLVNADMVHPNPDGQKALAQLVQAGVDACRHDGV